MSIIGKAVGRKEDKRLITGSGMFVEDVQLPGMLHLAFVRSSHAHAYVRGIEGGAALAHRGVAAVLNSDDWPEFATTMPDLAEPGTLDNAYCDFNFAPPQHLLSKKVCHVGQQIAIVLADDPYLAADGVDLVEVEYDLLPIIANWEAAIRPGATSIHQQRDNVVGHLKYQVGDVDAAFDGADIILEERFETQSLKSMAIECRGCAASWDPLTRTLNIWSTCQLPYLQRQCVARMLGLPYESVRVMGRDIGGSFGLKGILYPEDLIIPLVAFRMQRPIRWMETRMEHMLASNHSGTQVHNVKVAADQDGRLRGIDLEIYKDVGAYNHFEMILQTNTINHLPTHYKVPALRVEGWALATNTSPGSPYRGAGRVEAAFVMDRLLDAIARKTGLDPLDVRMRNMIRPEDMPYANGLIYRDGKPVRYDGGDFPRLLAEAVEKAGYHEWRAQQPALREAGRAVGIGISSYVEAGGVGPCEGATVSVDDLGRVSVAVGVNAQGQSHETTLAQVCADILGARYEDVTVQSGDTSRQAIGFGTAASRVAVNTGNAVYMAASSVKKQVVKLAAEALGCAEADVVVVGGAAHEAGATQNRCSLAELAKKARKRPDGMPGLTATEYFHPDTVTWASGTNIAVVEVDRDDGSINVLKYVFVHDCGVPLNPMVVDGQVYGGFAQGIGIALGEKMEYDNEAQVVSGSMMDYYVPRASDIPDIELHHLVTPTNKNPLGIRSVGESGPNAPPGAIAAAVEDAIGGNCRIAQLPITASVVLAAVRAASAFPSSPTGKPE